jgi:hypothetical protein
MYLLIFVAKNFSRQNLRKYSSLRTFSTVLDGQEFDNSSDVPTE